MTVDNELISGRKVEVVEFFSVPMMFLIAALVGAISICVGVLFNSKFLAIFLPSAVMLLYVFGIVRIKSDLPVSIVGDSYYYLGFILTLIALVASLLSLSMNSDVDINSIVGSFGAALVTTIIGLVARLVLTSFTIQAKERRERLENDIERSLTTFSAQLETLTLEVVSSITKVHTEAKVALETTLLKYDELNEKVASSFEKVHSDTSDVLSSTLNTYKSVNDNIVDQYASSMSDGEKNIKDAMDGLSERIENIEVSPELVSKPIGNALDGIIFTLQEHEKHYGEFNLKMMEKHNSLSDQLDQSGNLVHEHVNRLENALSGAIEKQASTYERALNDIGSAILASLGDIKDLKLDAQDNVSNQLAGLGGEIEAVTEGIRMLKAPIESSAIQMLEGGNRIGDSLTVLASASEKLNDMIEKVGRNAEAASRVQIDFEKLSTSVGDFNSQLNTSIELTGDAANRLNAVAYATEESSSQVAKDIAEVYKQLATQIRALKGVV